MWDRVLLKVSPWKGVVRFGKNEKLAPRYVGPFEIVECVGPVAYRLKLPQELSCVHNVFHVSNLKKCLADSDLQVPLEEIKIDDRLYFMEEAVEIVDRMFGSICISLEAQTTSAGLILHVKDEVAEDPREEPEEEFEEDPEEDPEENLEKELEVEAEDDVPLPVTLSVGSSITSPPLSESSSDTKDVAPIVSNEALEMPPIGSLYEVGGPSSVSPFPPFYLHGREIARLDDNTELLLSNVKYLEQCEQKRKAEMEANSFKISKVKKCMKEIGRDLGDEMQFSNLVENGVTKLEDKYQEKAEEMEKMKKRLGTLETNYALELSDQMGERKHSTIYRLGCQRDLDEVLWMYAQMMVLMGQLLLGNLNLSNRRDHLVVPSSPSINMFNSF
uniref:Putative reverse transcriptase domain-containing protein n=1 Tax=Tanacetum cinerariifolium TaxID=118510 RepID=A0A6L2L3Y1_TANCI|nr:putative reverse transcriptase domain-containing protein [Tanacetum cinerariifolium]